jgi:hypothetical protein
VLDFHNFDPFELVDAPECEGAAWTTAFQKVATPKRGAAARGDAALDKKGNYAFRPVAGWREDYAERWRWVQEGARIAFAGTNVARCGCVAAKNREVNSVPVVRLGHVDGSKEVSAVDVYTCDNGTVCPYCGRARARARRDALKPCLAELHTDQHPMLFATFTQSHSREDTAQQLFDDFFARMSRLISPSGSGAKAEKEWRASMGYLGGFRHMETNFSRRNGFHLHAHLILVFEPGTPEETQRAVWRRFRAEWMRLTEVDGYKAAEHLQVVKFVTDADGVAAYTAKGADWEMTSSHMKRGKRDNRSLTQLLEDIAEHQDPEDIALARAYHAASKGRQMFAGFGPVGKKYTARITQAQNDLPGDINDTFVEVCAIDAEVFKAVCAAGGKPELLHAADVSLVAVKAVLRRYGFDHGVFPPGVSVPSQRLENFKQARKRKDRKNDDG